MIGKCRIIAMGLLLAALLLATACSSPPPTPTVAEGTATAATGYAADLDAPTATATAASTPESSGGDAGAAEVVATSAAARTPIPTPTPDRIERGVTQLTDSLGLGQTTFLGLSASDWTDLLVSLLLIAFAYFFAAPLLEKLLKRLVKQTNTKADDQLVAQIGTALGWLIVVIFARYAVRRLSFLSDTLRTALNDILFIALLLVLTYLANSLMYFIARRYKASLTSKADQERLDPVITAAQRFATFLIVTVALSIALSYFGVNANTFFIVLLVTGLIIVVAAKETIAEALAGFLILIDQPFRVGDSVFLKEVGTWGEVLSIGTRNTRIRTGDNREVIVPNSNVVDGQIVNRSLPDPSTRVQVELGVAYGSDIDQVRQTIAAAVRGVDGVLADKPVDVLFLDWGDTARGISVRWWIEDFHQENKVTDEVNSALERALQKADIDLPFTTYDLNVKMAGASDPVVQPPPGTDQEETAA